MLHDYPFTKMIIFQILIYAAVHIFCKFVFPADDPFLQVTTVSPGGKKIYFVGSILDTLAGKLRQGARKIPVDVSYFYAGFAAGTPNDTSIDCMGEFLAINGNGYSRCADASSSMHHQLVQGRHILTTGAAFIFKETDPTYLVQGTTMQNISHATMTLQELYHYIATQITAKPAFCMTGIVHFDVLNGSAISRAPIYNENLMENYDKYFDRPPEQYQETYAAIMGCGAMEEQLPAELQSKMKHILYKHKLDKQKSMTSHTHAIKLHSKVAFENVTSQVAENVYHVFASSEITHVDLRVYEIDDLVELE